MAERGQQRRVSGGLSFDGGLDPVVVAAHELKTPLALVRQLSLELERHQQADVQDIARQVRLTAERSLRLTRDLTQTSRLQSELFPLEPLNGRLLLTGVVEELQPLYEAHQRQLVVRVSRRLPVVLSNGGLLRRVLHNFADNALHYAHRHNKVIIEGSVVHRREKVRFGVLDGGPHQSSGSSSYGRPGSSGLGLMIAESFAEAIGASTGVMKKGNGSLYYIDVPISKQLSFM